MSDETFLEATQQQRYDALKALLLPHHEVRFCLVTTEEQPPSAHQRIDRFYYSVMVSKVGCGKAVTESFDFNMGVQVDKYGKIPSAKEKEHVTERLVSFFYCIINDIQLLDEYRDAFEFMKDLGYEDPIKARDVWNAVLVEELKLKKVFTYNELKEISKIIEGY